MNIPEKIKTPFASGTGALKTDIPENGTVNDTAASMAMGFPPRNMSQEPDHLPPTGQDMNGILYKITDAIRFLQAGGTFPFDNNFCTAIGGYPIGAILSSQDGQKLYINTVANNATNPEVNGVGWKEIQDKLTFDSTPTADSNNPVTSQGIKAAIDAKDSLPSQTGQAGKVLTTDGTTASWQPVQSRNVGEYVWSALPLTDSGLHLLDGSIISEGGIYDAFVQHVAGLASSYPDAFCTETEWQASVNTYGSCGKFVYTQGTGVRLPKVSDIMQGTTDLSAVGDLVEAGLPNITGAYTNNIGEPETSPSNSAIFITEQRGHSAWSGANSVNRLNNINFDASRSSKYYKDSVTKPTPQTIKSLLYICVANSVKTQIQVDIDNLATDLNGKLDKSGGTMTGAIKASGDRLVGINNTSYIRVDGGTDFPNGASLLLSGKDFTNYNGKFNLSAHNGTTRKALEGTPAGALTWSGINISAMGMPENTVTDITIPASHGTVTAPADGWFVMEMQASAVGQYIYMGVTNGVRIRQVAGTDSAYLSMFLPVKKGDAVQCTYTATKNKFLHFQYAKGSAWEKA